MRGGLLGRNQVYQVQDEGLTDVGSGAVSCDLNIFTSVALTTTTVFRAPRTARIGAARKNMTARDCSKWDIAHAMSTSGYHNTL